MSVAAVALALSAVAIVVAAGCAVAVWLRLPGRAVRGQAVLDTPPAWVDLRTAKPITTPDELLQELRRYGSDDGMIVEQVERMMLRDRLSVEDVSPAVARLLEQHHRSPRSGSDVSQAASPSIGDGWAGRSTR